MFMLLFHFPAAVKDGGHRIKAYAVGSWGTLIDIFVAGFETVVLALGFHIC